MRRHAAAVQGVFGVMLSPVFPVSTNCSAALAEVKKWMEGQNGAFQRCGRREREGGRLSMRLGKRLIPEPCRHLRLGCAEGWIKNQTTPLCGDLPRGFADHVKKTVSEIFPKRWDVQSYVRAVGSCGQNNAACRELPRSKGGLRRYLDLDRYLSLVSGEEAFPEGAFVSKYSEVPTGGKLRPLTVTSGDLSALRPLHKIVYTRLCKQKWLLKGPPTPAKIKSAGFRFVHGILSGDYKGATDNLDLRVSHLILAAILDAAVVVPPTVKEAAFRSLRPRVEVHGELVQVERGQMMGSLLSFPLLCLYNYAVTTFALGKKPMLINGDDVVVETPDAAPWFAALPSLGLFPEPSKTSYRTGYLEINSTCFVKSKRASRVYSCPILRTRTLDNLPSVPHGLGSRASQFVAGLSSDLDRKHRKIALEFFAGHTRGLVAKTLTSGLSPGLLQIGPLWRVAGWNQLISLARKCAKRHARVTDAPPWPPQADSPPPSLPCYGTLNREQASLVASYGMLNTFEAPPPVGAERDVRSWWNDLVPSATDDFRPGEYPPWMWRFANCLGVGKTRLTGGLYFGEPLPSQKFLERYLFHEGSSPRKMVDSRIHLPPSVRWGVATLKWHAGPILGNQPVIEETP